MSFDEHVKHLAALAVISCIGCSSSEPEWWDELDDLPHLVPGQQAKVVELRGPRSPHPERSASFTFGCTREACEFTCTLRSSDSETSTACISPVVYNGFEDGEHVLEVAVSGPGRLRSEPATWEWTVDTEGPEIVRFRGPDELTNESSAAFVFDCSDASCDFFCELTDDHGRALSPTRPCGAMTSYDELDDGTYRFEVYAVDAAGNVGPTRRHVWTVDRRAPSVEVVDGPDELTLKTEAKLRFECSDESCETACELFGEKSGVLQAREPCAEEARYTDLPEDDLVFKVYAVDPAGNEAVSEYRWTVEALRWRAVARASLNRTCAIATDHTIWCWGNYLHNFEYYSSVPQPLLSSDGSVSSAEWMTISLGQGHLCGLQQDQTLWCWGRDYAGEVGNGDQDGRFPEHTSPKPVSPQHRWNVVSAGYEHTCGIRDDGTLWCWGDGFLGRLGLGDSDNRYSPARVGTHSDWISVSAGYDHTCGIRSDGSLWCWGYNYDGAVGDGTEAYARDLPVRVAGDQAWVKVDAGYNGTCGIAEDTTLWCWGQNYVEPRTSDDEFRRVPTRIGSQTGWIEISTGGASCGIRADGTLWCWGINFNGQLGDGTTNSSAVPVQVGSATDWTSVTTEGGTTCALRDDRTAWCWGKNPRGEIGDGTTSDRHTPSKVASP